MSESLMIRKLLLATGDVGVTLQNCADGKTRAHWGGFTLVEILVVIAVIGLLVAIAIPQFMAYRSEAVNTEMKADLRNASIAIEAYYAKQSALPASMTEVAGYGFQPSAGVTVTFVILSPTAYRVTAAKSGGTQASFSYDSISGSIQ
jgi:prepilin-type N-terminal cleavage/methylation domain-containing protein